MAVDFFVGLHHPNKAFWLDRAFVSVNALPKRGPILANEWVMDSGAFTKVARDGGYTEPPSAYAARIREFARSGTLRAAVAEDWMCERFVCARVLGLPVHELPETGPERERALRRMRPDAEWAAQIREHQRLTIERYDALAACDTAGIYVMPVLQGFTPWDYTRHLAEYGARIAPGAWVGVGSVCKRQGSPRAIMQVLDAIHAARPDLKLHGFGVKLTALSSPRVARRLASADSMAWSLAARNEGRDGNNTWEARYYELMVLKALGQEPGEHAYAFAMMLIRHQAIQGVEAYMEAARVGVVPMPSCLAP